MSAVLYTLADPRTPCDIRYVGWTSQKPAVRLRNHLAATRASKTNHRLCWLRSILYESLKPVMRTVAILESIEEAKRCEIAYIARLRLAGYRLVNGTDGGDGVTGYVATPETRARLAAAMLGKRRSPETCQKISIWNRGRKLPDRGPEWRAKISASKTGKRHSAERRARQSERQRGKPVHPNLSAAAIRANLTKVITPEQRAKISEAHRGKHLTPEHRAKIGAAGKGKARSPETRMRMLIAQRARRERERLTAPGKGEGR